MDAYKPTIQESLEFAKTSSEIEGETSTEAYRDHLQAWEYARGFSSLTLEKVLECHRLLQQTLRPDIAGKLRDVDVMVGGRVCPPHHIAAALLDGWISKYGDASVFAKEPDVDGVIRIAHVEFEHIHPFEDGNGRVGRILMNWHRIMNNIPPLIVHPGDEQYEYYKWFKYQA